MSAFHAVTTTDMQKRSDRWRQNTSAAPADCGQRSTHRRTHIEMNPTALSSLGRLRSIPLTARRRCALKKRTDNIYISNNITLENRNYEWRSGVLPSCCGALANGKLWVKARRAATFIDSQVHCLKAVGIPHSDLFCSRIVRLGGFDIRSVFSCLNLCVEEGSWSNVEMPHLVLVADNGE